MHELSVIRIVAESFCLHLHLTPIRSILYGMPTPFETYLAKIQVDYKVGKATERTYRSTLENLLEALERNVDASNDPKHIACGAPDFIVERRKVPVGYVGS